MEQFGDQLSSFDMIIALSPASYARAKELTKLFHLDVLFWDTSDPTSTGETRESKLDAYRKTRDEIIAQLKAQWGNA